MVEIGSEIRSYPILLNHVYTVSHDMRKRQKSKGEEEEAGKS